MFSKIVSMTQGIEYFASKNAFVYRLVKLYYKEIVKKEIELAQINEEDHILCIGGGPCPFTGILFHQYTKAKVTIVDNDPDCVVSSRLVIEGLGLQQRVKVLYLDGNHIDVEQYSVIHFALQVSPFKEVFKNVAAKCQYGTKLLARFPKRALANFCSHLSSQLLANCPYIVHPRSHTLAGTALYVKPGR